MFGFIKKLKTAYEVHEPLSVRERALKVFSRIEGLDDHQRPGRFANNDGKR
jgi:hypothetical protein